MPVPLPDVDTGDLVDRLNVLVEQEHIDQVELARLRHAANRLTKKQSSAPYGYVFLGMVASLNDDEAESRRNFEIACRLRPNDWFVDHNYSITLLHLGSAREAYEITEKIQQREPTDLMVLRDAIERATAAGLMRALLRHLQQWQALGRSVEELGDVTLQPLQALCDRLEEASISDDDLASYVMGAARAILASGVRFPATSATFLPDGTVLYRFVIGGGEDAASEATLTLSAYKAEHADPLLDELFTLTCVPRRVS
jgi:hypothetical protein